MTKLLLPLVFFLNVIAYGQTINTTKSQVKFEIGNMKLRTVAGTFGGMKGSLKFSERELKESYFEVCVDASSVNTNDKKRDDHLKTADFFDVSRYPTICFKSTSVTKTSGGYLAVGIITMHGVSKEIQLPFTYTGNTFTGTLTLNRLDYKVGAGTGTFLVDNEVKLTIICVLN